MLEEYYQEGLKLNPIEATFQGDNRYNNSFPNFLSDDYVGIHILYLSEQKNGFQSFI
jgi:hypothetical protein